MTLTNTCVSKPDLLALAVTGIGLALYLGLACCLVQALVR